MARKNILINSGAAGIREVAENSLNSNFIELYARSGASVTSDATLSYITEDNPNGSVSAGDLLGVWEVAASGASDHHAITAGGVKLYEAGPNFSTRERLVAAHDRNVAAGRSVPAGTVWSWPGASVVASAGDPSISDIPGWAPFNKRWPEHHGAIGDGAADDTAAVLEYLQSGGGETPDGKTYLIDPLSLSNAITVKMGEGSSFKARSWFDDDSQEDGIIRVTDADVTFHGKIDGNRDFAAISAGVATMRGTDGNDIETAEKSGLMVRSIGSDVEVDIHIVGVNCPSKVLHLKGADGYVLSGHVRRVQAKDCGAVAKFDRCTDLRRGVVEGIDVDNRIGADNDEWMPSKYHAIHLLRCTNCPGSVSRILGFGGRPGVYLDESASPFMNAITHSSNVNCPTDRIEIFDAGIASGTASDSGVDDVADFVSLLGFSDVSNIGCGVGRIEFRGTATQAWELIPGESASYGDVILRGNHGKQNVLNGSTGLNMHGGGRTAEDVADFRVRTMFTTVIKSIDVEGFHFGVLQRKGRLRINHFRAHGNRASGLSVNNLGTSEWTGATAQFPDVEIGEADIQWSGLEGINIVNGQKVVVRSGKIANNGQMNGYDDPTLTGGSVTRTAGVFYDSGNSDADTVDAIRLINVDTQNDPAITDLVCSYIPGTPGNDSYLPHDEIDVMTMTFEEPNDIHIGQRLTVKNVDGVSQDVDVWVRARHGDAALVEVDTATYAGAWADNDTALTGTWDLTGNLLEGASGALTTDLDGPSVVKTPNGYALLTTISDNDTGYLMEEALWGTFGTISGDFTGQSISYVTVNADYAQGQTEGIDAYHANVGQIVFDPAIMSQIFEMADDTVLNLTPPFTGAFAFLSGNFDQTIPNDNISANILFDVGLSPRITKALEPSTSVAADIETSTSDLDETTATDNKVTICALDTGVLRIINRIGSTRTFRITYS